MQVRKEQAFRNKMLDVLHKSPELQALGKTRDELGTLRRGRQRIRQPLERQVRKTL